MDWAERWVRATQAPQLLVVGGASLDQIHVNGRPVPTPGGAGLYTALAAARAGADVTMLAPLPHPMPPELAPALQVLTWVGPTVSLDGLPRFEIAYDADGAVTLFREHLGAEPDMTPALLDMVPDLPACAYCVPFMNAALQREFIDALRARGCLTVAATYGKAARQETMLVRDTLSLADLSFANDDEARLLWPDEEACAPGHFRFITRGRRGVTVLQGDHRTNVPGRQVQVIDPTGAGDTFCGTTVARILLGDHPVEAARRGNAAAAEMVTAVGPRALWQPAPSPMPAADTRAVVDEAVVDRMARLIADSGDLHGFDFTGELFPGVGDPRAVAWFTAATLQQYGFWYDDGERWTGSMIAPIDGIERKGSDYLWAAYLRWHRADEAAMNPAAQAAMNPTTWTRVAADDTGKDPFPDPPLWVEAARAYGRTMTAIGVDANDLVRAATASDRPLRALLTLLDHVGGYREDPLRKKAALLGVILRQRPEGFLPAAHASNAHTDDAPPIVDYHVQRTCLRTGMVRIDEPELAATVKERHLLSDDEEGAIRRAAFAAVSALCARSGRDMGTVDWFLFQMRHRCPEASTPDCSTCPARPACAQRVELFQPVFRTTNY